MLTKHVSKKDIGHIKKQVRVFGVVKNVNLNFVTIVLEQNKKRNYWKTKKIKTKKQKMWKL